MTRYDQQEEIIQRRLEVQIRTLVDRKGYDIHYYMENENIHSDVYGKHSGNPENYSKTVLKGIVVSDDFVPHDIDATGNLIEGKLYTSADNLHIGDHIGIPRKTGRERKYKIESVESIGTSGRVMFRYNITSMESRN